VARETTETKPVIAAEEVVIARVVKTRGIRGEVACDIETDFPERFEELDRVTVATTGGKRRSIGIEDCWFHKGRVILKFEGFDSIDEASELIGSLVMAPEMSAESLEEGQYHEHKLIGAEVVAVSGERIGTVIGIMHTGGTDILTVRDASNREVLIPFASEICPEVDADRRLIKVDPPPGLLDL
jgi:16S rRNA processing protein RimM